MNTIFIYLFAPSGGVFEAMQQWVYFNGNTDNTLQNLVHNYMFCERVEHGLCAGHGIFSGHEQAWAGFGWTVFRIVFWTLVAGELHRRKWYWAL